MISAIALLIAQQTPSRHVSVDWATVPLRSQTAQDATTSKARPGSAHPKSSEEPSSNVVNGNINQDPAFVENLRTVSSASVHIAALFQRRRIEEAHVYLMQFRQDHVDLFDLVADRAADCEILLGHYHDAYSTLVPVINGELARPKGRDLTDFYLRLSISCAAAGKIYSGQAEFCERWLKEYFEREHVGKKLPAEHSSANTPHAIMVLSCLALGMKSSTVSLHYLELTLKLDPTNKLAAREAILRYGYQGQYSDIRRIASGIIPKLPNDLERATFQQEITNVAGLKDKPRHYIDETDRAKVIPPR